MDIQQRERLAGFRETFDARYRNAMAAHWGFPVPFLPLVVLAQPLAITARCQSQTPTRPRRDQMTGNAGMDPAGPGEEG